MRRLILFVVLGFAFGFAGAALANHHAVKVTEKAGIGSFLTDAEGKTLYWFKKDMPGMSACAGDCVTRWPLYYREKVAAAGPGIKAEEFATIKRADGQEQTTFRGYPLYYFAGDAKPGDSNGQGLKEVWYVIDPANFPAK